MSAVLLGGNQFIDCQSILAYKGHPVLQVLFDPLRVILLTPHNLPSGPSSFAIFWRDFAVVLATLLDDRTAHLKLDLRPLGINIYDDFAGLHIGTNIFSQKLVRNAAAAINLGSGARPPRHGRGTCGPGGEILPAPPATRTSSTQVSLRRRPLIPRPCADTCTRAAARRFP